MAEHMAEHKAQHTAQQAGRGAGWSVWCSVGKIWDIGVEHRGEPWRRTMLAEREVERGNWSMGAHRGSKYIDNLMYVINSEGSAEYKSFELSPNNEITLNQHPSNKSYLLLDLSCGRKFLTAQYRFSPINSIVNHVLRVFIVKIIKQG